MVILNEMFSPLTSLKKEDQDVDWAKDLKFYIDNDEKMLEKYMFPAVEKHREHLGNPNVYKLYVKSIKECMKCYVEQFKIESPDEKFTEDVINDLAKNIADEQQKYIEQGDYDKDF